MKPETRTAETWVYAYLDAAGDVLYVGMSADLPTRHRIHARTSQRWWKYVTEFAVISVHAGRQEAAKGEFVAIREYQPLFNTYHTGPRLPASIA